MTNKTSIKRKTFVFLIVIIDIFLGLTIIYFVSNIRKLMGKQTLGTVVTLSKADYVFPNGDLKYYYEPKYGEVNYSVPVKPTWFPRFPLGEINADGLRERYDYKVEKDSRTYRIIALGDSWTFGLYVNLKDNYPERLEDILNERLQCKNIDKFEVINFGVPGHDIEYNAEHYHRKGEKYSPDLILWLFTDTMLNRDNELYLPVEKKVIPYIGPTITLEQFRKKTLQAYFEVFNQYGEDKFLEYSENAMKKLTPVKSSVVLLIFPSMKKEYKKVIYDFAKQKLGTVVFENLPNIPKDTKLQFAPFDAHPNELGYKLLSEAIYGYLITNVLHNCSE